MQFNIESTSNNLAKHVSFEHGEVWALQYHIDDNNCTDILYVVILHINIG